MVFMTAAPDDFHSLRTANISQQDMSGGVIVGIPDQVRICSHQTTKTSCSGCLQDEESPVILCGWNVPTCGCVGFWLTLGSEQLVCGANTDTVRVGKPATGLLSYLEV